MPVHKSSCKLTCISCLLLLCLLLTASQYVSAQQTPFTSLNDSTYSTSLLTRYTAGYNKELALLPKENKKAWEEVYKLRWDNIKAVFDKKEVYSDVAARQYLDALVAEITKTNSLLQKQNFQAYFSRSGVPNAAYIGEGIILFNMGLFKRLENESQVAFILCHEIAHFYLKHSEKNMGRYVDALYSESTQKELRQIQNTAYGKRQRVEDLMKGLTFNNRRHSRDHESEADSMGLEFMRHTRFNIAGALTALALLDSIDVDSLNTATLLPTMFNAKEYPFKKKWIAKNEGLLGGHAVLKMDEHLEDSMKTHPDCKLRIKILEPIVKKYQTASTVNNVIDPVRFEAFKNVFSYEIIEYAYTSDNYTRSLLYALDLLQTKPGDPYLITQVGKILNGFYEATKIHKLSKVIDLPAPFYPANYNLLLQFVQNLYAEDFALINYNYLKQFQSSLDFYKPFMTALNTSKQFSTQ